MPIVQRLYTLHADQDDKCYACGKKLGSKSKLVNVAGEDQNVFVGSECFKLIKSAGKKGYQPMRKGKICGPKLYLIRD